ncbi:hypothetical protein GGF38_002337, partial [Coemansia sp. RSA 25]
RSASVLNETELDDIMIQTAEMCHSIQSAIKLQRASESGLSRWISGALGCLGTAAASDVPNSAEIVKEESQLTESYEAFSTASDDAQAPVSVVDSEAALCLTQEFVSADSSPNVPQTDAAEDVECHRRVPSSSQASSLAMWAAVPEPPRSSSTSFDRVREPNIPEVSESAAVSQDSIEVADPVAVAVTPRRDSR